MGRHKILVDAKNVSVRLERSFLAQRPSNYKKDGTWIRDLLDGKEITTVDLNIKQKEALSVFYTLFVDLYKMGAIDDYVSDDLIEQAEIWREIIDD